MTAKTNPRRSLAEFVRDEKKKDCPVCKLPPDVIEQLYTAHAKKYTRSEQLAWLKVLGKKISSQDLNTHYSARHHDDE